MVWRNSLAGGNVRLHRGRAWILWDPHPAVVALTCHCLSDRLLMGLSLYWNAFPSLMNKIGAIAVDVIILVALLWAHWPASDIVP